MSKSVAYLKEAFAGESQANRKYLAFAAKADKEGHAAVARLFRAAAHAETVHAHAHLRAMDGVGDTASNLKEAIAGETYEYESMYPPMIEAAKEEGNKAAERSFTFAHAVELVHAELYKKALETLDSPYDITCYFVCEVCGHTVANQAPEPCPVCKAKSSVFTCVE